eukprot:12882404-Prorocentrum_lima.AAC.1
MPLLRQQLTIGVAKTLSRRTLVVISNDWRRAAASSSLYFFVLGVSKQHPLWRSFKVVACKTIIAGS